MRMIIVALSLAFATYAPPSFGQPTVPSEADSASAAEKISSAIGAGLQGDAQHAVELLRTVDASTLNDGNRRYLECMLARFGDSPPPIKTRTGADAFADQIVDIYQHYWRKSLSEPALRPRHTRQLEQALRERVGLPDTTGSVEIENAVRARLEAEGLHALLGQTGVLRELMIWRQEHRRAETVELPHGTYNTNVALLDDFVVSGWGQYATCETRGAGGWVADRTLFAVVPIYRDLEGEEFRVTFLGHETQHFLDLDRFPAMHSWELEYRAKLTELAMADETRLRVLQKFIEDQGDDPDSPHSYANRKVIAALMTELAISEWKSLPAVNGATMRHAAYELFKADTAKREK